MARVKRGVAKNKKRKNLLSMTKGYRHGRKSKIRLAKTAVRKAGVYAYRDRKNKKRVFRSLWQIKINAACHNYDLSYSKFIAALKTNHIEIDRKILAELAENHPQIFSQIIEKVR